MSEFVPITLGRTLRVAHSESFVFTETEHAPAASLRRHAHETAAISFVIGGRRRYRFDGTSLDCRADSAVFVPAGAMHSSHFAAERARGLMLEIRTSEIPPAEPHCVTDLDLAERRDAIRRAIWFPEDGTDLVLEGLAFELLAQMRPATDDRTIPRWLARVRDALHDAFRSPPRLGAIARDAGVDRSRLARQFRRHFGKSIGEYVRAIRVRRAWELVVCSDLPLPDVAAECGYADQSHMTRAFRRSYARTPGQCRDNAPRAFKTHPARDS